MLCTTGRSGDHRFRPGLKRARGLAEAPGQLRTGYPCKSRYKPPRRGRRQVHFYPTPPRL